MKQTDFLVILKEFFVELKHNRGLSDNTIKSYKATFRLFIAYKFKQGINAEKITFPDINEKSVEEFLNYLQEVRGNSITTRNLRLAAFKSFSKYAVRHAAVEGMAFRAQIVSVPRKKGVSKTVEYLTVEEVSALISLTKAKKRRMTYYRDYILLSLLYFSGCRAQEICDVRKKDLTEISKKGMMKLVVTGKGNKTRTIFIPQKCTTELKQYLKSKPNIGNNDFIFQTIKGTQLSIDCVERIFKDVLQITKEENPNLFKDKHCTPHVLRHSIATHMYQAKTSLELIKEFLGHACIDTTSIYAKLNDDIVIDSIEMMYADNVDKKLVSKSKEEMEKEKEEMNIPSFLNED